jgi:hypothetical protein
LGDPVYLQSRSINFAWAAAARAQNYTLLVSTNPSPQDDPAPLVRQTVDSTRLAYSVTLDNDYPALYWQVVAANASGSNASSVQRLGIDRVSPVCNLQSAPAGANTWQVTWAGLDNNGISGFSLRYTDSTIGQFLNWLINVPPTVTSAVFTGLSGHNYSFWCQALDVAGNDSNRRIYLTVIAR